MNTTIDLFPLNSVLFPYQVIPIQVFETRYLNMISKCFDNSKPFGICLINDGTEVGPPAIPHKTGTSAQIISLRSLENNKIFIFARGQRRFYIKKLLQEQPHIRVEIEWIDTENPYFPGDYERLKLCVKSLLTELPQQSFKIPQNENQIFGLVSALLSGIPQEKQMLLELDIDEIIPKMTNILERALL
ncbi:LON peptidase substrate-binding domain-containing protein [Candidatus Uabimicrobium sp. HlEnr_7]|uniref:LON peptidase substrate-binding domain-containing protein n=1 Tax=Candidatus Uabimicrobium helgolandensis TaxID=3095367 RepID=UPI003559351F